MTIHLNEVMIIGLCMLPGAFVLFFVLLFIFQSWEIGALPMAGIPATITFIAGLVMIVLGIGMEIH